MPATGRHRGRRRSGDRRFVWRPRDRGHPDRATDPFRRSRGRDIGRFRVTFVARDSVGGTDSTTTDVTVLGETSLRIASEPGDYVGGGGSYFYSDTSRFTVARNYLAGISVSAMGSQYSDSWNLSFSSVGAGMLTTGEYSGARAFGNATDQYPGLSVSRFGTSCSNLSGDFAVRQVAYDVNGQVTSLWSEVPFTRGGMKGTCPSAC